MTHPGKQGRNLVLKPEQARQGVKGESSNRVLALLSAPRAHQLQREPQSQHQVPCAIGDWVGLFRDCEGQTLPVGGSVAYKALVCSATWPRLVEKVWREGDVGKW